MFPFTYNRKFYFDISESKEPDIDSILLAIKYKIRDSKIGYGTVSFDYKFKPFKRNYLIESGYIDMVKIENRIEVKLKLIFLMLPIIYLTFSIALLIFGESKWFAFFGICVFTSFYFTLYIITASAFKFKIKKIIKEELERK